MGAWDQVEPSPEDVVAARGALERGSVTGFRVPVHLVRALLSTADRPAMEAMARAVATDLLVDELRERPDRPRILGPEQCCELGCDGGACETCPCCCAGWCVFGHGGIPEWHDHEHWTGWLTIAAEHNPVAAQLLTAEPLR